MVSVGGIYRSKSRAYSMVCSITLMMDSLSIFCLLKSLYKKSSSNGGDWVITDNKNNPANIIDKEMYANLSAGGSGGTSVGDVDLLHYFSNGFKLARTHASQNGDGNVYIYAAFAENPFVSSEGVPVTAR